MKSRHKIKGGGVVRVSNGIFYTVITGINGIWVFPRYTSIPDCFLTVNREIHGLILLTVYRYERYTGGTPRASALTSSNCKKRWL